LSPCCVNGLVCADAILHSEHGDGTGAGCQGGRGGRRDASDHVYVSWGPQPAMGVQERNDLQQVERVRTAQVR